MFQVTLGSKTSRSKGASQGAENPAGPRLFTTVRPGQGHQPAPGPVGAVGSQLIFLNSLGLLGTHSLAKHPLTVRAQLNHNVLGHSILQAILLQYEQHYDIIQLLYSGG